MFLINVQFPTFLCPTLIQTWDTVHNAARRLQLAVQQLDEAMGHWPSLSYSLGESQVCCHRNFAKPLISVADFVPISATNLGGAAGSCN